MNSTVAKLSQIPQRQMKQISSWNFKYALGSLGIRSKMIWGFVIAIAFASTGSLTGLLLESYYHQKIEDRIERINATEELLNELNTSVLETQILQSRLIEVAIAPQEFMALSKQLIGYVSRVEQLVQKVQDSVLDENAQLEDASTELRRWLQNHSHTIELFSEQVSTNLGVDYAAIDAQSLKEAQQSLAKFANSQTSIQFGNLSRDLRRVVLNFEIEVNDLQEEYLSIEAVATQISLVGLAASVIISIILAILIGRAIALPLERTNAVAKRVTEEGNFDLQVDVNSQDEVGQLATSLNQLIYKVKHTIQELNQTQTQLVQNEKMSSLGRMVAGVAHEINNPVNFIHGNILHLSNSIKDILDLLQLYQERYPNPDPEIQQQIEEIELDFLAEDLPKSLSSVKVGAERIHKIVLSLRNFSRLDEAEMKAADLNEGLESTLLILAHLIKKGIDVDKQYSELPLVECHPAQINQVFMNILSNAADALLSNPDQTKPQIAIATKKLNDNQVEIRIADNGSGIPPEVQAKIFDPFFTTKPVGKGTGLGLSISYQIVERHKGAIAVNSQAGKGTEFIITLPIKYQAASATNHLDRENMALSA